MSMTTTYAMGFTRGGKIKGNYTTFHDVKEMKKM